MGKFKMITKNCHSFYDMSSMLQKSIRRGNIKYAAYAANELKEKYRNYLWKRLLVISAEDCYGVITKEIIALKLTDDEINKKAAPDRKEDIFISKAIVLLCQARKNRDACYLACNYMNMDYTLPEDKIEHVDLEEQEKLEDWEIPSWVFDVHTLRGKYSGKTINDMIVEEQAALQPKQLGLFDNADWGNFLGKEGVR